MTELLLVAAMVLSTSAVFLVLSLRKDLGAVVGDIARLADSRGLTFKVGDAMPMFEGRDLDGRTVVLPQSGHSILVFLGSACALCTEVTFLDRWPRLAQPVVFVSASEGVLAELGSRWEQELNDTAEHQLVVSQEIFRQLRPNALPLLVRLDKDQKVGEAALVSTWRDLEAHVMWANKVDVPSA